MQYHRLTLKELVSLSREPFSDMIDYKKLANELAFKIQNNDLPAQNLLNRLETLLNEIIDSSLTQNQIVEELTSIINKLEQILS